MITLDETKPGFALTPEGVADLWDQACAECRELAGVAMAHGVPTRVHRLPGAARYFSFEGRPQARKVAGFLRELARVIEEGAAP